MTKTTNLSGLIWFDDTRMKSKKEKKTDREKILEGITYCKEKYKCNLTNVEININSEFSLKKDVIEDISVKKVKNIMPDQFWIMIPELDT